MRRPRTSYCNIAIGFAKFLSQNSWNLLKLSTTPNWPTMGIVQSIIPSCQNNQFPRAKNGHHIATFPSDFVICYPTIPSQRLDVTLPSIQTMDNLQRTLKIMTWKNRCCDEWTQFAQTESRVRNTRWLPFTCGTGADSTRVPSLSQWCAKPNSSSPFGNRSLYVRHISRMGHDVLETRVTIVKITCAPASEEWTQFAQTEALEGTSAWSSPI